MMVLAILIGMVFGVAALASDDSGKAKADLSEQLQNAECKPVVKDGKKAGYDCSGEEAAAEATQNNSGLSLKDDDELVPAKAKKPLSEKARKAKEEIESRAFILQGEPAGPTEGEQE